MGSSLTAAGLLADIVGVAFIGFAFLQSDARNLLEQAQTTWDYSPEVLSALAKSRQHYWRWISIRRVYAATLQLLDGTYLGFRTRLFSLQSCLHSSQLL
jgi:hypothetical protein